MDKEDEVVKESVPKAEETTPEPEHVPPVVNTKPDDDVRDIVNGLKAQVDELTETVSHIVTKAEPDTTPVKRPWTHWGNR